MGFVLREGWQSRAGNWGTVSELGLLLQRLVCCPTLRRSSLILYFESFALLPNAKWACLATNQVASFPFPPFFQIHCLNPLPFCLKEDAYQREILCPVVWMQRVRFLAFCQIHCTFSEGLTTSGRL